MQQTEQVSFGLDGLEALIERLGDGGRRVIGPRRRPRGDGTSEVVWDDVGSPDDLPRGWHDEQEPGRYELVEDGTQRSFGVTLAASSPKSVLHPAAARVWTLQRSAEGEVAVHLEPSTPLPTAFVGVRPCELAAIGRQDTVLLGGPHADRAYRARRDDNLIVAVNCTRSVDTCFCTSMGTGPAAGDGADIVLTELLEIDSDPPGAPRFVATAHTDVGAKVLDGLETEPSTVAEVEAAQLGVAAAAAAQIRSVDTVVLPDALYEGLESKHWADVAERCLTCGNCTLVCPTCFCTDLVDTTDLGGEIAERWRQWDSCFSLDYSHMGPGSIRSGGAERYRQWLVHKLGSWHDQFGESGCVGCGRCITWCPVGIDLTAELREVLA